MRVPLVFISKEGAKTRRESREVMRKLTWLLSHTAMPGRSFAHLRKLVSDGCHIVVRELRRTAMAGFCKRPSSMAEPLSRS